jgi:hypothetical protein
MQWGEQMNRIFLISLALTLIFAWSSQQTIFSAPKANKMSELSAEIKPDQTGASEYNSFNYFEIYITPMAAIYNGGTGIINHLGASTPISGNIIAGAGVLYEQVNTDLLTLKIPAGYLFGGYTLKLGKHYRIVPALKAGGGYISVAKREMDSFAAGYISPYIQGDVVIPETENFRFGVNIAYDLFIGSERLRGVSSGLYISYMF